MHEMQLKRQKEHAREKRQTSAPAAIDVSLVLHRLFLNVPKKDIVSGLATATPCARGSAMHVAVEIRTAEAQLKGGLFDICRF